MNKKHMYIGVFAALGVFALFFIFTGFNENGTSFTPTLQSPEVDSVALSEILRDTLAMQTNELITEDVVVGEGEVAEAGDVLTVHYTGALPDGTVFDSSVARGEPFRFQLGAGMVIAGWDQGFAGMREGGKRILVIPPSLGYGEQGIGPIPGDATLVFEVELLEVEGQ